MISYKRSVLAVMTAAFIWLTAFPAGATDNDIVRIGIREGQSSVSVAGPFGVGVYRNGSLWKKYAAGKNVTVAYSDKGLTVDGATLGQRVLLRSLDAKGALKKASIGLPPYVRISPRVALTALSTDGASAFTPPYV